MIDPINDLHNEEIEKLRRIIDKLYANFMKR
jgi:hypothetical protein